jgi:hypothetical protein
MYATTQIRCELALCQIEFGVLERRNEGQENIPKRRDIRQNTWEEHCLILGTAIHPMYLVMRYSTQEEIFY